jgi:hypothetical protein
VHDSIKKSGKLTPQQLTFFDMEDGDATLYELRMLSITQRSQAAAYIADMQLGDKVGAGAAPYACVPGACERPMDSGRGRVAQRPLPPRCVQEAQTLARAVKDHERRGGAQEGFSTAPGDCLAYKLFRDVSARSRGERRPRARRLQQLARACPVLPCGVGAHPSTSG